MGSYSQLTIADYPIFSTKNSYFQELTNLIFLPEDFIRKKENILQETGLYGVALTMEKKEALFSKAIDKPLKFANNGLRYSG